MARLSGDEFAIAVSCDGGAETVVELSERIVSGFNDPLPAGPRQHRVRVSIGGAVYPDGGHSADELLSNGHLALCRAKAIRGGAHVVFENSIRRELEARLALEASFLLQDEDKVLDAFRRIRRLGVRIVFDDFGTGYASLSYLKKFPLDGLKIDRSFVRDLLTDSDDAAIVGSTVGLSRQLGLSVIAEGIEDRATADFLLSLGCEDGQGYFFGRPMPVADLEARFMSALQGREAQDDRDALDAGQAA